MRMFFAIFAAGLAIGVAAADMAIARDAQTDGARSARASRPAGAHAPAGRRAGGATHDRPTTTTTSRNIFDCQTRCMGKVNPFDHGLCVQMCLTEPDRRVLHR